MTYEERLELAKKFNKRLKAGFEINKISVEKMIKSEELTEEDSINLIEIYDRYAVGKEYSKGMKFRHEGVLYEVLQPETPAFHVSQEDWVPSENQALYKRITPGNVIEDFVQPTSTKPYLKGTVVRFEGNLYECTADSTVYSPTAHPPHWKKLP